MDVVITVLVGFLVRLGIPIAVTAVVLVVLYQLDKNWQKQAQVLPVVPSGKPCWEVKGCSEESKKNCPAATRPNVPCWHVFKTRDGVMKDTCLNCEVFRRAPVPVKV